MNFKKPLYFLIVLLPFIFSGAARAQPEKKSGNLIGVLTTEFTYQGKLTEGNANANGNYDFEFKLTDANGNVLGTLQRTTVPVKNGIFTVRLDFGFTAFNTLDNKYLEIGVRKLASGQFDVLAPRQPITATPISIVSSFALNANFANLSFDSQKLGGVEASGFVSTNDARLSDARQPLAGSADYIQNSNFQQTANFSISGKGAAGILEAPNVNALFQYSLNGGKFITAPGINNTFLGINAGTSWAGGDNNTFFGKSAGQQTTTGRYNAFFGSGAGQENTTGRGNAFFGGESGISNTEGIQNSFFGSGAGRGNTTGEYNAFFGYASGLFNTTARFNAFFGASAGQTNATGEENAFFGSSAGFANTTGSRNTFVGTYAGGQNSTGGGNTFVGGYSGNANKTGTKNTALGDGADFAPAGNLTYATAIGADAVAQTSNTILLGRITREDTVQIPGKLKIETLGTAGGSALCLNGSNQLALCSSSIRYKSDVQDFTSGLEIVRRLRPVSFTWKDGGRRDLGFVAEEVAQIEPLMTVYNQKGEIEGVKYDRISAALVNAAQEQQAQIEKQRTQIEDQARLLKLQQAQIEALKKLVCSRETQSDVCREEEPKK